MLNQNDDFIKKKIHELIDGSHRSYDKNGDRHYDVISAFIKSMRGSDPNSALVWLATMLDGGEDPLFIARRIVIFASEDIGNADPQALVVAASALTAVKNIGMPESRIILSQAVCYMSSTVKSNASYNAIDTALAFVREQKTLQVPDYLKNKPPLTSKKYLYPHNYPENFVEQNYSPINVTLPEFYKPSDFGTEKRFRELLEKRWKKS